MMELSLKIHLRLVSWAKVVSECKILIVGFLPNVEIAEIRQIANRPGPESRIPLFQTRYREILMNLRD